MRLAFKRKQQRRKRDEIGDRTPPPKYRSHDFLKPTYWRLRGPLDLAKERFVSLPGMSRDNDSGLLVGSAGWDALALCHAVAAYYTDVTDHDGWAPARLTPLLAVLQENLPWVKQWHNDIDPDYNQRLGDFYETYLHSQLSSLGLSETELQRWSPPQRDHPRRAIHPTRHARQKNVPGRSPLAHGGSR